MLQAPRSHTRSYAGSHACNVRAQLDETASVTAMEAGGNLCEEMLLSVGKEAKGLAQRKGELRHEGWA